MYANYQIAATFLVLTFALAAVETILLPNTENKELKKLMTEVLPAFKGHLAHTEKLAKELGYL